MLKVEIISDNFVNGFTRVAKGEVIEVAPPIAKYIVKAGNGKIVGETDDVVIEAPAKKRAYKRRDIKAET